MGLSVMLVLVAFVAIAQDAKKPPEALVSIYNVAPGKHLEFLKWLAAREAVGKELGIAATVIYVHTNGASWDYVAIAPVLTAEQDKAVEELSKKKGLTTGFKASLEFRQMIASHSDTFTIGPVSAADAVSMAQ